MLGCFGTACFSSIPKRDTTLYLQVDVPGRLEVGHRGGVRTREPVTPTSRNTVRIVVACNMVRIGSSEILRSLSHGRFADTGGGLKDPYP